MVSRQQWLGVRLRHSWHRVCLRYFRSDSRKKSRSGMIVTRDRNNTRRRRRRRFFAIVIKCGLVVITTAAGVSLLRSWQEQDESSDDFRNSVNAMYEQGTPAAGGDRATVRGREPRGKDALSRKPYDPKARVFVDPNLQLRWGPEAEKGREKRRLFMKIHEMSKDKGRPQLTLRQLMALPSTFDPSRALSDTTIILNHWKRTTLADQLDAILNLTVAPAGGVWVCLFDSPREEEYRAVVEEYRERFTGHGGLFLVASSFNFKYYGRFQLALQARTRYVWIVDDDVLPGRKFLEQLSHIAGIPEANGWKGGVDGDGSVGPMALGSVGWIMPGVKPYNGMFYGYRYRTDRGGLYLPDKRYGIPVPHLQEVDLLCSHWFVERNWVPLLFREHWETAETGEDYMLAYSLRKYAGVRSYVVPMDLTDCETWGNTDVDWDMQNQGGGATTLHNMVPMRDRLWHRLFKRGGDYFLSPRYARSPRPILIVVDSEKDAALLRPLFLQLEALSRSSTAPANSKLDAGAHSRPPRVVLTLRGGTAASCALAAAVLSGVTYKGRESDTPMCNPQHFASAWQLYAGRHYSRDRTGRGGGAGGRDHTLMLDLATGILGAVETVRPLAVVSVGGSGVAGGRWGKGGGGAAIDEALSAVSTQSGVPLIRLPRMDGSSGAVRWLAWLSPEAFGHWQDVRLDILVLYDPSPADDGLNDGDGGEGHTEKQLAALLTSLGKANYLGDDVRLTIAVSAGSRMPDHVSKLEWRHGPKRVRESLYAAGDTNGSAAGGRRFFTSEVAGGGELSSNTLAALALRSWVPQDSNNYVLVLEANSVVSEFFYSWLRVAVLETNYADDPPLEAEGGRDGRGGEGEVSSAGSAGAYSVCLPNTEGGAGAWLLAPSPWRSSQARCYGDGSGVSGALAGGGEKRCGRDALIPPSERSLCPSKGGALVTNIDAEGYPLSGAGSLIDDDDALVVLAKRALFHER